MPRIMLKPCKKEELPTIQSYDCPGTYLKTILTYLGEFAGLQNSPHPISDDNALLYNKCLKYNKFIKHPLDGACWPQLVTLQISL